MSNPKSARTFVLAGLVIGGVASLAGYEASSIWQSWRVREEASASKTWPPSSIFGQATVEFTTRCAGSRLSYTLAIIPPESGAATILDRIDQSKVMTDRIRKRLPHCRLGNEGREISER